MNADTQTQDGDKPHTQHTAEEENVSTRIVYRGKICQCDEIMAKFL